MNYIWYPFIKAIQLGYDTSKIQYRVNDRQFSYRVGDEIIRYKAGGHHISPLLEYLPLVLYDPDGTVKHEDKLAHVDVNPYYRFGEIFSHILQPERNDPNDLLVCDVITHILAHIDRICGMSKRDFRLLLIMSEIDGGSFGDTRDAVGLFSTAEERALADAVIMLYETSNGLRCLDTLFRAIMTDFHIRLRDNDEVVFYNPYTFDERDDKKLRFIIRLFLPIDFSYVIHWQYTYGTIEHDESMVLEEFVL